MNAALPHSSVVKTEVEEDVKKNDGFITPDDSGIFDEIEASTQGFGDLKDFTDEYAKVLSDLTTGINSAVKSHGGTSDFSQNKLMFDEIGELLEKYTEKLFPIVENFSKTQAAASNHFDNVLILMDIIPDEDKLKLRSSIGEALSAMNQFHKSLNDGHAQLQKLPRSTKKFNIGRRKFLENNETLSRAVGGIINSFSEYEEYLES
jgi:hypothetical protein